jgi:acyl transferase domain-containing protein/NAD(P)H-dependent flavin oxidoreductase YrpB (nitropropane dioxygenase family)
MAERALERVRIVGISPLERPDAGLVAAVCEAGALGVLDLGRDPDAAASALATLSRRLPDGFGVRVPDGAVPPPLPPEADVVIVTSIVDVARFADRAVIVQVRSVGEARAAIAAGARGLVAKGSEAGGLVGEDTTFVLVQRIVREVTVPVWAQGGIGLHTAAACIAGGATGVVIDSQLALVRESSLGVDVRGAIAAMDGSETTVLAGHRVYTRPDLPVAKLDAAAIDVASLRARLGGDDLARSILPLGQDAAFARPLAARFATAARLVRGLDAAITGHLAQAAAAQPLAQNAPLAAAHGMKYPIAQGPMSRVSDRAAFADAVAAGGALPFLALTLMTGGEARELLRETAALLGDRPWGVGILGFVPPEIREQQLAVLKEIPPPVALIAGGRPSQAAPLEAQGTATYLHVPSPGLLDLFLRDGARKFVFEGRECGGHVGPRSSFALWEAQIERLLAHPAPAELSVLFAGGIHDARSAAMVAAMAAPLAAKGAKVGVLMGTAYLFTEEAVAAGAIQSAFQAEAIACEDTVLLETAPGHATRCADTAFAAQFAEEKARLEKTGAPAQERWAALEQLNLGRLRIAAKGLRRDGGELVTVDAGAQRADGMYMIGQVAALRSEVITVAQLHKQVCDDGAVLLETVCGREAARANRRPVRSAGTDVAVIGLAAIFPGAPDTDAFWTSIVTGKNAVREVPPERWDAATYYDPAATSPELAGKKTPCKWGGFLDDIAFDPLAYGIPPKSLAAIEPVQLLSLEIARRAIADAGYADREFDRERCAVIFGAEAGTDLSSAYSFRALFPQYVGPLPRELDATLPTLSEDSFPGVLSNVIAGRIANRLDLGGVNYTVDAACAASLAAVDMAVKELVSGASDMVLCGGADLHNSINDYLLFASVHALSPSGQCHTFDADADGIVLGEGVACVVLKRLADAERDGDRVYAVIKGAAGASDGKSLGLTAPRKDGQIRALDRAYKQSGVSPAQVGLVEAHGTGTVVGDRTELATLTDVYTRAGAAPASCVLGSVKSQIGHTKCAAGMAGLIKATLAVYHGVLPPTLNIKKPNPAWDRDASPFVFLDQARPWPAEERIAAVSAFGFGGTNFHAVLASHRGGGRTDARPSDGWPAELFLFRGDDRAAAVAAVERLQRLVGIAEGGAPRGLRLRDLARSVCAAGRGPVWIAIVAESIDDLRAKLDGARAGTPDRRGVYIAHPETERRGAVAFLCPGQGSQRPGMLADLFVAFPRLHRLLELGARWARRMYPPAAFTREERAAQAAALTDTRVAQPALGIADLAVAELLQALGVRPELAGGHSYGELAALCIAGAIDERDLLALSETRGESILDAAGTDAGSMVAVAADASVVAPVIAGCEGVVVANHNSPSQCVLSGPTAAIEMAMVLVAAAGLTARRIPVACAFHSPVVAGAKEALGRYLDELDVRAPRIPVYSNVTGAAYPDGDPDAVRALLAEQVAKPVRFAQEIEAMYAAGARIFVETGPGQVLTRLVGEILGERPHVAVATDTGGNDPGVRQLLRAVATLAAHGVPVDPSPLFWDRDAAIVELDPEKRGDKKAATMWLVNGQQARPMGSALPPRTATATLPPPMAMTVAGAPALVPPTAAPAFTPASERDGVVVEYLRNMRSMISAQRDVMLQYLGGAPAATYAAPVVDIAPAPVAVPVELPALAAPAPVAPPSTLQLAITIVSERTGYPADTLGLDLDLEADLSIDSIKRIEIIGELAARLGLRVQDDGANGDAVVEELATRKTLRGLVGWLDDKLGTLAAATPVAAPAAAAPAAPAAPAAAAAPAPAITPPTRYTLSLTPAPLPHNGATSLAGKRVGICGGGDTASALASLLAAEGAHVRHAAFGEELVNGHSVDMLVHLGALSPSPSVDHTARLGELFARAREAALGGATQLLVATACGGHLGHRATAATPLAAGGAAGLVKTIAAEYPAIRARAVDLDPTADAATLAAQLRAELHAHDDHLEVGYVDGVRSALAVAAAPLPALAATLPLSASQVVLVTGGARGITARAAIELARQTQCRIELVGRSPLPEPTEDPALASLADAPALRRHFIESGVTSTSQVEQQVSRVLADREIRATLAAIRAAGSEVTYHAVDARTAAFTEVVAGIYARHGRLDGAIHGAGLLEDKLVRDKTAASFARVVATKLAPAHVLASALRDDVRFVVFFASISGAFGNRGQVDYAAANDALDKLALALAPRLPSTRVVSIDWGPWAGTGMVSPALAREYARRGIALVDASAGIAALLAELAAGPRAGGQVILTSTDPRALVARAEPPNAPAPPSAGAAAGDADA